MHIQEANWNEVEKSAQWSALHTHYQHERKVEALLSAKGFETFLPAYASIRRWKDRTKRISEALFPGYLFVADVSERRLQVITTPGVCAIVCVAGTPATIPGHEIEAIRKCVSDPAKVAPHPYLRGGDSVQVQSGPLAGVAGILVRMKDSFRLVVSVEILGRAAAVEIDASCVRKTNWGRPLNPGQVPDTGSAA
jgi:transcription termination/antitermination protein NusG